MAVTLSAIDIFYFKQELSTQLLNSKVEQVYQHDAQSLTIRFYKAGVGKIDLFISPPKALYITTKKPAASLEQFSFCGISRKYLPSSILTSIEQLGFSRVLQFTFEYKSLKYSLIIELYDKGNVILIDSENKILSPLETQRWQNRTIASGQIYIAQPSSYPQTHTKIQVEEFAQAAAKESMTTSKFAAVKFGLGSVYGALLCSLANISPTIIISKDEAQHLFDKLPLLFSQKLSPCVLYENKDDKSKNVVGVAPFSHQTFAEFEPIDSLSQAYEKALFLHNKPVSDPKLKATTAAQKKFQNIVSAQNASIATLSAEVVKNQKVATYLYENHTTFEKLLSNIKSEAIKCKTSQVSASLKSLGVTTYNPAKKTVIVDIPELVE